MATKKDDQGTTTTEFARHGRTAVDELSPPEGQEVPGSNPGSPTLGRGNPDLSWPTKARCQHFVNVGLESRSLPKGKGPKPATKVKRR
jgi:hypothetical protein